VYNVVIIIRSYFSVFADIAKMWIEISMDNIIPGLQMVDKCSKSADQSGKEAANALKEIVKTLQDWSATASKVVADLASKVRTYERYSDAVSMSNPIRRPRRR
jgi:hypothetical protein